MCRVVLGPGPLETSVLVSIEASDAGTIPGEWTVSNRLAGARGPSQGLVTSVADVEIGAGRPTLGLATGPGPGGLCVPE